MLEEQALDPDLHDRKNFDCGIPELNDYLARLAGQHRRLGISATYVLVASDKPRHVLGYYSLSAAQVSAEALAPAARKRLPRYPVPCFRMGRLACRSDQRGRGLGKLLVGLAVSRCLRTKKEFEAFALIVDAKNEAARAFYERYGFVGCAGQPATLYLPLGRRGPLSGRVMAAIKKMAPQGDYKPTRPLFKGARVEAVRGTKRPR